MAQRAIVCPNCNARGSIDLGKFKSDQFTLRCPKCGEHFDFSKERRQSPRKIPLPAVRIGPYGFDFETVHKTGLLMDISTTGIRMGVKSRLPKNGIVSTSDFIFPASTMRSM